MSPEEYEIVARVFAEACDLPTDRRASYLKEACRDYPQLRADIEAMLAEDDRLLETAALTDEGLPGREEAVTGPAVSDSTLRSSGEFQAVGMA